MTAGPPRHPHEEQRARIRNLIEILHTWSKVMSTAKCTKRARQIDLRIQATHCSFIYHFFMIQLLEMKKVLQGLSTATISLPSATYSESDASGSGYICNPHCIWQIYRTTYAIHARRSSSWKELINAAGKRSRLGVKSCLKFDWIFFFF